MSNLLVISDTHNSSENFRRVLAKEKEIDFLIHLGDIGGQEDEIRRMLEEEHPLAGFVRVTGNCDEEIGVPYRIFAWEDARILLTHGHRFGVKRDTASEALVAAARAEGCCAAFFGHTHVPFEKEEKGILLFNPGSLSQPRQEDRRASYGMIRISEKKITGAEIRYL